MSRFPRYTSFKFGEIERLLAGMTKEGTFPSPPHRRGHSTLVREFSCTVTFPDGREGECHYDRRAPAWHLFRYQYCEGIWMPYVDWSFRLDGGESVIQTKAQELAEQSYRLAIAKERKEYFQRASEPSDGSRKRTPEKYRLSAATAKADAGYYAVCKQSAGGVHILSPVLYKDIENANTEWRERGDTTLRVLCCNRLDRCFELPRYNPLYKEYDPRDWLPSLTQDQEDIAEAYEIEEAEEEN